MARHRKASPTHRTRRRLTAMMLAVVGLAGLGLASAAQLNVTSGSLAAGTSVVASCQTSGTVSVGFTTGYVTGGYQATGVTFSGVHAGCAGRTIEVQLLNGTNPVGTVPSRLVPAGGGTFSTLTFTGVPVTSITGVAVVIHS